MGIAGTPISVAPPIDAIVQTIVENVNPRRVVLYGSYARGEARTGSDLDLMVELDSETDPRSRAAEITSHLRSQGLNAQVDVKVYSAASVERLRDDPGTLLYAIVREGRELYRRPDVAQGSLVVVKEEAGPPESLNAWVSAAEADLLNIKNNLAGASVSWATVGFHAQQAAEKYLKALLVQRRLRPDRTHSLPAVLTACREAGHALEGLDADCALLSSHAVQSRYPDDEAILRVLSATEGLAAADAANRIVAAARRHLPTRRA